MQESFTIKLSKLNQAILKSVNVWSEQEIAKIFTNTIIDILKANYGFCFLKNSPTKKFELAYKFPGIPFEPPLPRASGVTQQAFKQKFPVYEADYTKSK